jgi:NADH dehydrogenase [ubiquinone] 1 alpha subcomplex assembly factor 1
MSPFTAPDKLLFDFSSSDGAPAWQVVNDNVMGGISTGRFSLADGAAVFQGGISLENNGGFASVRSPPASHDLTGCDAFVIRVRGDGRRCKFCVRTGMDFDTLLYQHAFTTRRGEWQEHRLPFRDFVPTFRGRILSGIPPFDPARVASVGFLISDKQAGRFRLEIASIGAVGAVRAGKGPAI